MISANQIDQASENFWRRRGVHRAPRGDMGERVKTAAAPDLLPRDESCPLFPKKADLRPLAEREAAERKRLKQAEYFRLNHAACLARQRAYHQRVNPRRTPAQRAAWAQYARDYYQKNRATIRAKQNALTPRQRARKAALGKLYYQQNKAILAQMRRDRKARRKAA